MVNVEKFADELVKLSVTELLDLKKVLKDKYGLEETQSIIAPTIDAIPEKVEEKTSFTVKLTKVSEETKEKLGAVKLVNRILSIGLQPSMALVKEPPVLLKENVSKTEAEAIKAEFNALNAVIEIE